jgi:two-component system response regulator AlgR
VRRERLESTLAHAARVSDALLRELGSGVPGGSQRRHIAVRERGALRLIPLSEVWYLRAEQKYVSVGHAGGEDLIEESLRQLEREFDDSFVRIHRSVLVAVDAIERLERDADGAYQVSLRGTCEAFPVSRRQLQQLKARIASGR